VDYDPTIEIVSPVNRHAQARGAVKTSQGGGIYYSAVLPQDTTTGPVVDNWPPTGRAGSAEGLARADQRS